MLGLGRVADAFVIAGSSAKPSPNVTYVTPFSRGSPSPALSDDTI